MWIFATSTSTFAHELATNISELKTMKAANDKDMENTVLQLRTWPEDVVAQQPESEPNTLELHLRQRRRAANLQFFKLTGHIFTARASAGISFFLFIYLFSFCFFFWAKHQRLRVFVFFFVLERASGEIWQARKRKQVCRLDKRHLRRELKFCLCVATDCLNTRTCAFPVCAGVCHKSRAVGGDARD